MNGLNKKISLSVKERSGGRCEARLNSCRGRTAVHMHHRKRRGQGGQDDRANLLHVCVRCHRAIHANPSESYALGLLVHSWANPGEVPVTPFSAGRSLAASAPKARHLDRPAADLTIAASEPF